MVGALGLAVATDAVPRNVMMLVAGSVYENAPLEIFTFAWSSRLELADVSVGVTDVTEGNPARENSRFTAAEFWLTTTMAKSPDVASLKAVI